MPSFLILILLFLVVIFAAEDAEELSNDEHDLLQAAMGGVAPEVLRLIETVGVNPNIRHRLSGQTPIMAATLRGHDNVVEYLLGLHKNNKKYSIDIMIPEKDGYTPAHGAAFQGRGTILKLLHEAGVNIKDDFHKDGYAPLHRACWGNEEKHAHAVFILREVGNVNLGMKAKNGETCAERTTNEDTKFVLSQGDTRQGMLEIPDEGHDEF